MDQSEQPLQKVPDAPYPAPPPFWKHFTVTNVEKFKQLKDQNQAEGPLPLELTLLRPPPPPSSQIESYTAFSQVHATDTKPVLPPDDQLLFNPQNPNLNHALLLTKLTRSLLLNFLELTTVLSLDPTKYSEKMDDIRQLLLNVHVVINMYRPHQARESVKDMLEGILEDGKREIEECDRLKKRVDEFLGEVEQLHEVRDNTLEEQEEKVSTKRSVGDDKLEEARKLWKMIREIEDD